MSWWKKTSAEDKECEQKTREDEQRFDIFNSTLGASHYIQYLGENQQKGVAFSHHPENVVVCLIAAHNYALKRIKKLEDQQSKEDKDISELLQQLHHKQEDKDMSKLLQQLHHKQLAFATLLLEIAKPYFGENAYSELKSDAEEINQLIDRIIMEDKS